MTLKTFISDVRTKKGNQGMESTRDHIFHAQTSEGYIIKFISDFLKATIKTNAEFCIDENKILLRKTDENSHYLVEVELKREEFDGGYHFDMEDEEELFVGINLTQWQKLLKTVKKKDQIEMYIRRDNQQQLGMVLCSAAKKETCHANIFKIPKKIEMPIEVYSHPKVIPSSEFQKMIKKLSSLTDKKVVICIQGSTYASFYADGSSVIDSKTEFGDFDKSEDYYEQEFYISDLKKIVKMPGMSKNMKIYAPDDSRMPIKVSTKAGGLGVVSVYMKHAKFIEAQKMHKDEMDEGHEDEEASGRGLDEPDEEPEDKIEKVEKVDKKATAKKPAEEKKSVPKVVAQKVTASRADNGGLSKVPAAKAPVAKAAATKKK